MVKKLGLETKDFKGFNVTLADGSTTPSRKKISQLNITLGRHLVKDKFYIVDMGDMDVILGTLWMHSLGRFIPKLEICFVHEGTRVTLDGISDGSPRVISSKKMERTLRHGQVEWMAQCLILDKTTSKGKSIHIDIQPILKGHKKVFSDIPPGLPPKRGFEHFIELEEGTKLVVTTPYRHPNIRKRLRKP